jgi:hypothetical protein
MTDETPTVTAATSLDNAWAKVRDAFAGFIGNADAIHAVQRGLVAALIDAPAGQPIVMAKVLLFSGPPSVGKTYLANLVTSVLDAPLVYLDGSILRSRERLFEMIDDALDAREMQPKPDQPRSGTPVLRYPRFACFVDEIHLVGAARRRVCSPCWKRTRAACCSTARSAGASLS